MKIGAMLLYIIAMDITPGPNNLTMLWLGSQYGLKGTRKFLLGSMGAFFVKAMLCALVNTLLSDLIPQITGVMKWAGAAYMLYLAAAMARSGWKEDTHGGAIRKESTCRQGVLLQVLNMKSWIGALTLFAVYVIPYRKDFLPMLLTALIFTFLMFVSSVLWGAFGSALRNFITKFKKPFGIAMGLSLLYCAVSAVL